MWIIDNRSKIDEGLSEVCHWEHTTRKNSHRSDINQKMAFHAHVCTAFVQCFEEFKTIKMVESRL